MCARSYVVEHSGYTTDSESDTIRVNARAWDSIFTNQNTSAAYQLLSMKDHFHGESLSVHTKGEFKEPVHIQLFPSLLFDFSFSR